MTRPAIPKRTLPLMRVHRDELVRRAELLRGDCPESRELRREIADLSEAIACADPRASRFLRLLTDA